LRQDKTLESLFVLFIFCNPTEYFDVGVDGCVFILANFGEATCSWLLAILTTYCGNAVWWKNAEVHLDGGST